MGNDPAFIHGIAMKPAAQMIADPARVARYAVTFFAEGAGDLHQYPPESRAPILVVVRREIRSAEEDFAVRRQKRRQRPAALATQRLNGSLVASIDVRPLIPIDLDADEVAIENLGDARVLVRLAVHDVAPVAPHRADVEQDRLVLGLRSGEGRLSPREPVHGLVRGGFEVGGRLGGQRVQLKNLMAVLVSSSAPITSDSSSISNVGLWCGALPLLPAEPTNAKQPGTRSRKYAISSPPILRAPSRTLVLPTRSTATSRTRSLNCRSLTSGALRRRYCTSARAPNAAAIP